MRLLPPGARPSEAGSAIRDFAALRRPPRPAGDIEERDLNALNPRRPLQRGARLVIALVACLALSACFLTPYKIEIQQGNYIDPALIARLKPGMTRSQVRFLLGTPLLTDPFHPERWDYMFMDRKEGKLVQERRLTLWFEGDSLQRAVTDVPAQAPATASAPGNVATPARATAPANGDGPGNTGQSAARPQ